MFLSQNNMRDQIQSFSVGRTLVGRTQNEGKSLMCVKLASLFLKIKILTIVPECSRVFVLYYSQAILSYSKSFSNKMEKTIFFANSPFLKIKQFLLATDCSNCSKHCSKKAISYDEQK